jgi:hypothetical protein
MTALAPVLTPHGVLTLKPSEEAVSGPAHTARIEKSFVRGAGHGLLSLGADEVGTALPPVLSYWRELGSRYVTALCTLPGVGEGRAKSAVPVPAEAELNRMAAGVPPMMGAEYLTASVLAQLWREIDSAFDSELAEAKLPVQEFLKARHPRSSWSSNSTSICLRNRRRALPHRKLPEPRPRSCSGDLWAAASDSPHFFLPVEKVGLEFRRTVPARSLNPSCKRATLVRRFDGASHRHFLQVQRGKT